MNKLIETAKELDRILESGIEVLPNSPIHEKLKKALNIACVNARTFKIGEKVQWRGMELIVVEIGVNELLIATDMNPDAENYNDWWVGVEYVR